MALVSHDRLLLVALVVSFAACGQLSEGLAEGDVAPTPGATTPQPRPSAGGSTSNGNDSAQVQPALDTNAGFVVRARNDANLCLQAAAGAADTIRVVALAQCSNAASWRTQGASVRDPIGGCLTLSSTRVRAGVALRVEPCSEGAPGTLSSWRVEGGSICLASADDQCAALDADGDGDATVGATAVLAPRAQASALFLLQSAATSADSNAASPTPPDDEADEDAVELAVRLDLDTKTNDTSAVGGSAKSYSGPAINFPNDTTKWDTWDNYWQRVLPRLPRNNTAEQNEWMRQAILHEASVTGLDARFILAVVLQESSGDVHVHSTNNGVNNPGLMQSHNGASFADVGDGGKASIFQMIKDGCEGTKYGDGMIQGVKRERNYFGGARWYNSGTIDRNNLSNALGATGAYCSDLANRVMGRK